MVQFSFVSLLSAIFLVIATSSLSAEAFVPVASVRTFSNTRSIPSVGSYSTAWELSMSSEDESDSGVVELVDDDEATSTSAASSAAPFLSQGEISEEALNPDLSDPKQTRVIIYIIVSLIPVLFLVPFMLGSRDLIPLDMPVQM